MAGAAQPAEQVASLLHNLKVDSPSKVGESAEASPNLHSNASEGNIRALALVAPADVAFNAGVQEGAMESSMYYTPAGYATPHGFYYECYEYPAGEWDDFANHLGFDGVEIQTPWDLPVQSVYDENGSVVYHTAGYSFAAQPMYGPYAPGTPIPTMGADGQLYGAQPYPYSGHLYHQPALPAAQFIPCASSVVEAPAPTSSVGDPLNLGGEITNHTFVNVNGVPAGSNPGYPVALVPLAGPYGQGVLPVNAPIQGPLEARAGYEGIRASTSWSDTRVTGGQQRHGMSQPLPPSSLSGQLLRPVTPMLTQMPAGQQHGPSPDVTGTAGTFSRVYQPSPRTYSGSNTLGRLGQGLGSNSFEPGGNGHSWTMIDRGKPRGQGNGMMGDGNGTLDILNEQNRGPRTARIRNQGTTTGVMLLTRGQGVPNGTLEGPSALANKDQYNRSDFLTKYDMAKFFVIKSYSEDDVHKSIKYNVWASTPNGNKKLEAAYQEAHQKSGHCPIFLFFSVNASGQFCGVAEMVGPVDFNKSMDFWQQDKWSGKFPVKWHIIKDVPNNQFRHIILENNDNKPVTNSRDTQEVRLDQGVEMLNLFKNYIFRTSILDDFQFYENRQKAMQEKRARQQAYQQQQQGFAYRAINEYEPRRTSDETQGKSLEGKLVEAGDKGDKSGKNKDLELKSSTYQPESSDKGVSSSDKPLPRSLEKRESLQSNGAKTENMSKTFPDKQ